MTARLGLWTREMTDPAYFDWLQQCGIGVIRGTAPHADSTAIWRTGVVTNPFNSAGHILELKRRGIETMMPLPTPGNVNNWSWTVDNRDYDFGIQTVFTADDMATSHTRMQRDECVLNVQSIRPDLRVMHYYGGSIRVPMQSARIVDQSSLTPAVRTHAPLTYWHECAVDGRELSMDWCVTAAPNMVQAAPLDAAVQTNQTLEGLYRRAMLQNFEVRQNVVRDEHGQELEIVDQDGRRVITGQIILQDPQRLETVLDTHRDLVALAGSGRRLHAQVNIQPSRIEALWPVYAAYIAPLMNLYDTVFIRQRDMALVAGSWQEVNADLYKNQAQSRRDAFRSLCQQLTAVR